jgi:hypothetical protein
VDPGTSDLLSHVLGNRTAYTHGAISQLAQMQHFLETHGGATGARAAEALSQLITKLGG